MNCNEYIAYIQKEIEEKNEYMDYKHAFENYKTYLEERLEKDPKDVEAACQLGIVLLELRKSEEECLHPLETLLMNYEDQLDDWQKVRLHINIAGICEYGLKCRAHLEKAVTLNLPIPNGYDVLGRLYMKEDNYAVAETLFARAVQFSKEPIYRYNYAVCCYLLGEKEQGTALVEQLEQTLEEAENVLEEEIDALYFLGKGHKVMEEKKYPEMQIRLYCKDECYLL